MFNKIYKKNLTKPYQNKISILLFHIIIHLFSILIFMLTVFIIIFMI